MSKHTDTALTDRQDDDLRATQLKIMRALQSAGASDTDTQTVMQLVEDVIDICRGTVSAADKEIRVKAEP